MPETISLTEEAPNVSPITTSTTTEDFTQSTQTTPVERNNLTMTNEDNPSDNSTPNTISSTNTQESSSNQNQEDQLAPPPNDNIPPPNAFIDSTTPPSPLPPPPHHRKWVKACNDHPTTQIIGNLSSKLQTRKATANECLFSNFLSIIEPSNVQEALVNHNWAIAIQEELNQFERLGVWEKVKLPLNRSIIGTKWLFKNKSDENGIVIRNKARLVAKGYSQQEGIDYDDTESRAK